MEFIKTSIIGLLLIICIDAFSQKTSHPEYVRSHFREIQTRCIKNKIKSNYDVSRFEILSNYNNGVRFIFPGDSKYKWRVWKSTTKEDYYVVLSLHRDRKTGDVKSSKIACVIIDLERGIIRDEKSFKNYYLFTDPILATFEEMKKGKETSKAKNEVAQKVPQEILN